MGAIPKIYGPYGIKLRQIQYRSFQSTILIYHFSGISIDTFRRSLTRAKHGYVASLFGPDEMQYVHHDADDDIPVGCVEVAYLPNAFSHHGSALGFRSWVGVEVEWMCFDRPILDTVLSEPWTLPSNNTEVEAEAEAEGTNEVTSPFDHVADLSKGQKKGCVTGGNEEHRLWNESLRQAGHRKVKLTLTWKNRLAEKVSADAEAMRKAKRAWRKDSLVNHEDGVGVGNGDEEVEYEPFTGAIQEKERHKYGSVEGTEDDENFVPRREVWVRPVVYRRPG